MNPEPSVKFRRRLWELLAFMFAIIVMAALFWCLGELRLYGYIASNRWTTSAAQFALHLNNFWLRLR